MTVCVCLSMLMQSSKLIEWFLCVVCTHRLATISSSAHHNVTRCGKSENSTAEKINSHTVSAANKPKRLYRWSVCNKLIVCLQNRWLRRHCVLCVKGKYCDSISERRSIRFPHFGSTTHNARLVDGKFSKYTWMEIRDSMPFVLLLLSLVQSPWHSVLCYAMLYYAVLFCWCAVQRQQ